MSSRITGYNQFLSIVHNCFRGGQIEYESKTYSFSPRILKPYDLIKKRQGKDEFEKYLDSINSKFSEIAKSELYRKGRGWIKKGAEDKKIRTVEIDGELFILPRSITENSIGIDTSEDDEWKYIGLFIIPDYQTAYYYLENHLELPKTRNHEELRWGKLNQRFRQKVLDRFSECLKVCCEAALIIKTNIFYKAKSHYKERLNKIIEGCFEGYERTQGEMRHSLKNRFFKLTNGTRTHCDDDFCPLKPSDVVEVIVEELAFSDGRPEECSPTCVLLESHQSKPIQIADILIGSIKQKLKKQNNIFPLKNLDFFQKPIKCYCKKKSWSYYFI